MVNPCHECGNLVGCQRGPACLHDRPVQLGAISSRFRLDKGFDQGADERIRAGSNADMPHTAYGADTILYLLWIDLVAPYIDGTIGAANKEIAFRGSPYPVT